MRFFTISAITVAFLATISAKINFGPCRTDIVTQTLDDYAETATAPYPHRIFGIDSQFIDLIDFFEQLGFVMPINYVCDDLSSIPVFNEIATRQYEADQDLGDDATGDWDEVNFLFDDEDEF